MITRARRLPLPAGLRAGLLAGLLIALASCDRPGGQSASNPADATGGPATSAASSSGPTADEPLPDELARVFNEIRQSRYGPARVQVVKFLEHHPDDGRAEFLFGLTYHRERRYGKARPHFERALELAPDYIVTRYFLGWCLFNLGDLDGARRSFEQHLAASPDEGDTHFALGLIDLEEGRLPEAETALRRAIELQADQPGRTREVAKAHARLADLYLQQDDLEQARRELEIAVGLYPDHYESHYMLSRVLARLGEDEAAEQAHREFLAARERVPPGSRGPE